MICSEARLAANRANGSLGRGPVSPQGRETSKKNALKHGLTGKGIVTPEGDHEEIARRVEAFTAEMKPRSQAGVILILQMATLSVRSERAAVQESAAIARNVRHAPDDFDESRIEQANDLFAGLGANPRTNLRKLTKMPEGVERLIEEWRELRADLTIEPTPEWAPGHLERAGHLIGLKSRHARGSRLGALSRAYWGDFDALGDGEGGGLDGESRREWARSTLIEQVDAEIAALEAHHETLDSEIIAIDRAEAGRRALFDASKPACLARRYESEASRGFFKCLKEFRKVEAEFAAQAEAPKAVASEPWMGSFREMPPPPDREPVRAVPDARPGPIPAVQAPMSEQERRKRRPKLPR